MILTGWYCTNCERFVQTSCEKNARPGCFSCGSHQHLEERPLHASDGKSGGLEMALRVIRDGVARDNRMTHSDLDLGPLETAINEACAALIARAKRAEAENVHLREIVAAQSRQIEEDWKFLATHGCSAEPIPLLVEGRKIAEEMRAKGTSPAEC